MQGRVKGWETYDKGDPSKLTRQDLEKVVQSAAKAANQRLRTLEKHGYTERGVYKTAQKRLGQRTRYKERTSKLTINQLRREYVILREFLSAKSSTITGRNDIDQKRYETAVNKHGFDGTIDDFYDEVEKYYTEDVERRFSSNVVYKAINAGMTDVIDDIIAKQKAGGKVSEGQARIDFYREYEKRLKERKTNRG